MSVEAELAFNKLKRSHAALMEALEHVLERYDNLNAEYAASQGSAGDGPWADDGMTRKARAVIAQTKTGKP